jgi:carboxymethylenebutenolidase
MPTIDRRAAVAGLALLAMCYPARAGTPEQFSVDAEGGLVALSRYAADQAGKRPGVLLLHGSRGFELKPRAYERYANALSEKGIDRRVPASLPHRGRCFGVRVKGDKGAPRNLRG